jgi:hypothetical protein
MSRVHYGWVGTLELGTLQYRIAALHNVHPKYAHRQALFPSGSVAYSSGHEPGHVLMGFPLATLHTPMTAL